LLLYKKDSLNVSDAGIVYDKSAEIVFSSVGPILSLMIEIPKPKLLLFRGVFIDAVFVTGAPSSPTHCVLCNAKYSLLLLILHRRD
jgi:hypothetical protein